MSMLLIAIFSLNRAILLEALLNSVTKNLLTDDGLVSIKELYDSTDEKFDELYNDSHWSYRFSIDGHIYNTKFILSFIKRILYVNPNSFEGVVCQYAKIKN